MDAEKLVKVLSLLSRIIAGLEVPLSLSLVGENFLGTARQPFIELREELHMFGYSSHEEVLAKLEDVLGFTDASRAWLESLTPK